MSESKAGMSKALRDIVIITSILVLLAVAYGVVVEPPERSPVPQHGTIPGQDGTGTTDFMRQLPEDYGGLVAAGNQLMDAGRYAEAAEGYRRALEIDGTSQDVRTDFGACLHAMGLAERALEEFRGVLAENPDHQIAHFNSGIVFHGMGQADSARYYWEKLLSMDPDGRMASTVRDLLKELDE